MISLLMKFLEKANITILLKNILLVISWSLFLLQFKNYSNLSDYIIIPSITTLTTKYLIGDLDKGYIYTVSDIIYWSSITLCSILTIYIYKVLF